MSGGSYNYGYRHIFDLADDILSQLQTLELSADVRELRERFARHLMLVANAARAIEYVDSGDMAPGAEMQYLAVALKAPEVKAETDSLKQTCKYSPGQDEVYTGKREEIADTKIPS